MPDETAKGVEAGPTRSGWAASLDTRHFDYRIAARLARDDESRAALRALREERPRRPARRASPPAPGQPADRREEARGGGESGQDGPVLEVGDRIEPPAPPPEVHRAHHFRESPLTGYRCNADPEDADCARCEEVGNEFHEDQTIDATACAGGYDHTPSRCRLGAEFGGYWSAPSGYWEWLTVKSRMRGVVSHIEADTRDLSPATLPNPTHAIAEARHYLEVYLSGERGLRRHENSRPIVCYELFEPDRLKVATNHSFESEVTVKVWLPKGERMWLSHGVFLYARSDGWAHVSGSFQFLPVRTWWDGMGYVQAEPRPFDPGSRPRAGIAPYDGRG